MLLTSLRPERPGEELEQPRVLLRCGAARYVAVRAHKRGMPQGGPLYNADRKGPKARGLLGGPWPLLLGDDERQGGVQAREHALPFRGPALHLLGAVHAPPGAVGDVEFREVLREPPRQPTRAAGEREQGVAQAAEEWRAHGGQPGEPIGGGDHALCHRPPLPLVGVEERSWGPPTNHQRQLPGEVRRVLDAGVHPLPARVAVHVRGVPTQEDASLAEAGGDPVLDAEARRPDYLLHTRPPLA